MKFLVLTALFLVSTTYAQDRILTDDKYEFNAPVAAAGENGVELAGVNVNVVKVVEEYLNNLKEYAAKFRQLDPDGVGVQVGTFQLKRPKQFIWDYQYPANRRLIATGSRLFFVDDATGQVTQLPLNSGMASVFLGEKVKLQNGELMVTEALSTPQTYRLSVELPEVNGLEPGVAELVLQKDPLQLLAVNTTDPLGQTTRVEFYEIAKYPNLPDSLFNYTPAQEEDFLYRN